MRKPARSSPLEKAGGEKGSGRKQEENGSPEPITEHIRVIAEKDEQIRLLKAENRALLKEKQDVLKTLEALCQRLSD